MNRDGSDVHLVTDKIGIRGRNDWSRTGDLLATYIGSPGNHSRDIYTFGTDGSNMQMITDGGDNVAPSFSPDGRWITFMSYRDHFWDEFGCEIYIMRVDGSDVRRLTANDICDWQPRWGR
jgi:TolB protein